MRGRLISFGTGIVSCAVGFGVGLLTNAWLGFAAEPSQHWSYGPDNGPAKWASLSPEYRSCSTYRSQSPIDISGATVARPIKLSFSYKEGGGTILNNGHTVQVNLPEGNFLSVAGRSHRLLQFHFHTPSENRIQGKSFPMEMHMVHRSSDGKLAVLAVMIEPGGNE